MTDRERAEMYRMYPIGGRPAFLRAGHWVKVQYDFYAWEREIAEEEDA